MKTRQVTAYLSKEGIYLTEEQASNIAFILEEEVPAPTPEQRAAWRKELFEKCPTPEDRLALMAAPNREAILDIVRDVLEDNAFIQHDNLLDPNITFQELNMDSLDITRLVVEVGVRFGIVIDTEDVWPTNVTELVNQIESQLKRT